MKTLDFIQALKQHQYDFFTGVPCSIFTSLIQAFYNDSQIQYISAPREDSAVGMAAGAYLAGKKPVVLMQNSGLGYCLNVLTSLNMIYKIPTLLIVSWRGYLGQDAPEHIIMGSICIKLCQIADIPYSILEKDHSPQIFDSISETLFIQGKIHILFLREGILS